MSGSALDHAIDFWRRLDLRQPPFAHPDDLGALKSFNHQYADAEPIATHRAFVSGPRFGDFNDLRFHLSLLPVPFCGNIRVADVFILLLNPGFSLGDYYAEFHVTNFRSRLEKNIVQEVRQEEFPFMWLDPEYSWQAGFNWWEKKLRDVIREIASKKYNRNYIAALRDLARRIACIELVPYRSTSFQAHRLIDGLESVRVARSLARHIISDKDNTVIVTRQVKAWNLPENAANVIVYQGGQTRGASLGPESEGGRAILRRYGIIG